MRIFCDAGFNFLLFPLIKGLVSDQSRKCHLFLNPRRKYPWSTPWLLIPLVHTLASNWSPRFSRKKAILPKYSKSQATTSFSSSLSLPWQPHKLNLFKVVFIEEFPSYSEVNTAQVLGKTIFCKSQKRVNFGGIPRTQASSASPIWCNLLLYLPHILVCLNLEKV